MREGSICSRTALRPSGRAAQAGWREPSGTWRRSASIRRRISPRSATAERSRPAPTRLPRERVRCASTAGSPSTGCRYRVAGTPGSTSCRPHCCARGYLTSIRRKRRRRECPHRYADAIRHEQIRLVALEGDDHVAHLAVLLADDRAGGASEARAAPGSARTSTIRSLIIDSRFGRGRSGRAPAGHRARERPSVVTALLSRS